MCDIHLAWLWQMQGLIVGLAITTTITINSSQQDSEVYCVHVGGCVTVDENLTRSAQFVYSPELDLLIVDVIKCLLVIVE